jgi:hypothetical protein
MNNYLNRVSSFILILLLVAAGWPVNSVAYDSFVKGANSSAEAAGTVDFHPTPSPIRQTWNGFYSQPDSSETIIFEEEEERNLVKEITVWVIGAAFVGYFIIKVFLEGEEEEQEPDKPVKEIPTGGVNLFGPSFSF